MTASPPGSRTGRQWHDDHVSDAVRDLSEALARARTLDGPTRAELDETYEMALLVLFRLLFVVTAEARGFLPGRHARYDEQSLTRKIRDLHQFVRAGGEFDEDATDHWDDVTGLSRAIHRGDDELGLPAYGGRLLSEDPDVSAGGALLSEIRLDDATFGPILVNLLVDETDDDSERLVDFRDVDVREFGVVYEGLLASELAVANRPLTVDAEGRYTPVETDENEIPGADEEREMDETAAENVVVRAGEVYFHSRSGERKAAGAYYTQSRFVEHLLDHSLEPALDEHVERVERLRGGVGRNAAADAFFDFRVADIAMGSGHFLVGAVDRIESRLSSYLSERPLLPVEHELDTLAEAARDAFAEREDAPPVSREQLLRRQVARRCLYGVDQDPLATELARVSLWLSTFVPGLPLTSLDYTLVTGDSLAGIGTVEESRDALVPDPMSDPPETRVLDEIRADIARAGDLADASAARGRGGDETRADVDAHLDRVRARFDALAAARLGDLDADFDDDERDPGAAGPDVEDVTLPSSQARAREVLASFDPLHFPAAFPEVFSGDRSGFDVVVGNPPWEKTKAEAHEFWARHRPGLRSLPQAAREREIRELERDRADLAADLRRERRTQERRAAMLLNGPYPGLGSGDPDLSQAFCWRFWHLLAEDGSLGVVLPRETFLSKGSEAFRRHLLDHGVVTDLTFVLNSRGWAFEGVHPQTTVGIASVRKASPDDETTVPIRGPYPSRDRFDAGVGRDPHRFPRSAVLDWTATASFPLLPPVPGATEAFDRIQRAPAVVGPDRTDWRVVPYRTGITASDCVDPDAVDAADGERDPDGDEVWPVYKGGSFDVWVPDTGVYYGWGRVDELLSFLGEKRRRSRKWPDTDRELPCFIPTIAYRRVTRATDSRTVRAALVPPAVFVRDADPVLLWEDGSERDEAYLLGVLSSIPTDWYARRFVEKHLDYYLFDGIPVPQRRDDPLCDRVVELSGRLAAVDERYDAWAAAVGVDAGPLDEGTKRDLICELDAVVAHLYGLSREHLGVVFETFHDGWDHAPRLERVLASYDEWADRLDLARVDPGADGGDTK